MPNETQATVRIQSYYRGNKTRSHLEGEGKLPSQRKPKKEESVDHNGPPYVNNMESEHVPANGTINFIENFPETEIGRKKTTNLN